MNTLELDHQLNTLIIQGKSADAFKKFYAENVVAQENDDPERVGRDQWMRTRAEFERNMTKFDARLTFTTRQLTRPRALVIIPRAGHVSNMEYPEAFNRHVRGFCLRYDEPESSA